MHNYTPNYECICISSGGSIVAAIIIVIIIIIIQEISIAHNPEVKAGAQCAHRKTQNELPL